MSFEIITGDEPDQPKKELSPQLQAKMDAFHEATYGGLTPIPDAEGVTVAELLEEWSAAEQGYAVNQGWQRHYDGGLLWLMQTASRGRPHLELMASNHYRIERGPFPATVQNVRGRVSAIIRHAGQTVIIPLDDVDAAEKRLAAFSWPRPPQGGAGSRRPQATARARLRAWLRGGRA